jgi:hypothetical protein
LRVAKKGEGSAQLPLVPSTKYLCQLRILVEVKFCADLVISISDTGMV